MLQVRPHALYCLWQGHQRTGHECSDHSLLLQYNSHYLKLLVVTKWDLQPLLKSSEKRHIVNKRAFVQKASLWKFHSRQNKFQSIINPPWCLQQPKSLQRGGPKPCTSLSHYMLKCWGSISSRKSSQSENLNLLFMAFKSFLPNLMFKVV